MQYKTQEGWRKLCQQASIEQDPERLSQLVAEIVRLLDEKLHAPGDLDTSKDDRLEDHTPSPNSTAD